MRARNFNKEADFTARLSALAVQQEERLAAHRAKTLNLPYVDLFAYPFDADILEIISKEEAAKAGAIPFYKKGTDLRIGAVNPSLDEFKKLNKQLTKKRGTPPQIYVISHHSLNAGLKHYRKEGRYLASESDTIIITSEQLADYEQTINDLNALGERVSSVAPTKIMSAILAGAITMRASDIHLEPRGDKARLRYRIDGVLQNITSFGIEGWKNVLSRTKILSDLKLNIHDIPQEGSFVLTVQDENFDVRVSILPGGFGEYIVMRLLNRKEGVLELTNLGMKERDIQLVRQALKNSTGMILSAGPTGSGKTTTITSCLREVNRPELKIITLEDPVEYRIPGIEQTEVDPESGYTFAVGLRSILRQDPDIIFVGEMRDVETAETSVHAAMTGHLVFSTIHANDAPGVILRLIDIGIQPYVLAPAINLVIAQRLVRLVCKACAEEYKLDSQQREHIAEVMQNVHPESFDRNILADKNLTFLKAKGCNECGNTGYRGRTGVFELFAVSGELEEMILEGADGALIKEAAIKNGMTTIAQDAYLKVFDKLTTVEEVERISEE